MNTVKISVLSAGYCSCPEHMAIQGGRWKNIRFPAMFALLEHPRFGPMLFDTGYSYRFFSETAHFPFQIYRVTTPVTLREEQLAVNQLAAKNIRPGDITHVFISHFHADHIAALGDFPKAKYVYLPQAFDWVQNKRGFAALSRAYLPGLIPGDFAQRSAPVNIAAPRLLPPEYAPFTHGFDLLGDDSLLAIELPGHATGQMGLITRDDRGESYFFVADAAWLGRSIQENLPPNRMANFLFTNPSIYRATLSDLHHFSTSHSDMHILPSHCEQTLKPFFKTV